MLSKEHYKALSKLESKDFEERREGKRLLMELESEGKLGEAEIHQLLEYDKSSILFYVIEAVARIKIESAYPKIEGLLQNTSNPYLFNKIVESFTSVDFPSIKSKIIEKLKKFDKKVPHELYDKEQSLIFVLKYLQERAELKDLKFFLPFLDDSNPKIVINTLQIFSNKEFPIKKEELENLKSKFKNRLLIEQVDILLHQLKEHPNYS